MLDAKDVNENLRFELDALVTEISDRMQGQNLPFLGEKLLGDNDALLVAVTALQKAIESAIDSQEGLRAEEVGTSSTASKSTGKPRRLLPKKTV